MDLRNKECGEGDIERKIGKMAGRTKGDGMEKGGAERKNGGGPESRMVY